jgi:hypothetical protein
MKNTLQVSKKNGVELKELAKIMSRSYKLRTKLTKIFLDEMSKKLLKDLEQKGSTFIKK